MKKIGSGWQYNVYQLSDNRVLKVELSDKQRFWVVMLQTLGNHAEVSAIRERLLASLVVLKNVIGREGFNSLVGTIVFKDQTSFEQDKAIPLGVYFRNHSFQENCAMIDEYIKLTQNLWKYGVADRVFSSTINSGVLNGGVILLDIGELTDSRESVVQAIETKRWERAMDYYIGFLFRPRLRRYYRDAMRKSLTIESLEKYWNTTNSA